MFAAESLSTMTLYRVELKCIPLILLFTIVQSGSLRHDLDDQPPRIFKIVEKNNGIVLQKDNLHLDQKSLVNFLKNNADLEYRVNNIIHKPSVTGRKRKLTKRIVEHGEKTPDLQYDHDRNSYFKPLVRLHKTKKLDNDEEPEKLDIQFREKVPKWKKRPKNYGEEEESRTSESQHAVMHLIMIEAEVKRLRPPLRDEFYGKLNKMLQDIEHLHRDLLDSVALDDLRNGAPLIDTMEEVEDPLTFTMMPGSDPVPTPKAAEEFPCAIYPDQPLWNYWTYAQTLHQDECPRDQVKIGNVCSWTPPHRKK